MNRRIFSAVLLCALTANVVASDKIDWKPIPDAILQIDARTVKSWNVYRAGKKSDPILVQIGMRMLVVYVRNQTIYEIKPETLEHKGEDLFWHETDRPEKPLETSDWNTKDVGSAMRIQVKLAAEGRHLEIEIPQTPDLRRGIY